MIKKANKPRIRFKGFNDAWEEKKYRNLAYTKRGLTYSPSSICKNGIRVLRSSNIKDGELYYGEDDVFVKKAVINIDYVKINNILITAANGSTKLVGKHALIKEIDKNSAVHGGFMLLAIPTESPYFLNTSMSSNWYKNFIKLNISGGNGAIGNLNKNNLEEQKIPVPSIDEQYKLGMYFKKLDNLIAFYKFKYNKYKNIKNALLEKMFPKNGAKIPEIRFKGFTDAWEQRKLGDVVKIEMGQSPNGSTYSNTPSNYILVQGNSDLENGWVKPRLWTTKITKQAKAGDLIMSVRAPAGSVGKTAYNIVIGRGVAAIKGNEFIYQTLVKMENENYWRNDSTGSTFESLNSTSIKNAKIKISKNNEQIKIGNLFSTLDNLITLHQRMVEKLKKIKSALLEKMFV